MPRNPDHSLLPVGKVLRPHGLRGQLKISAYARSDATFLRADTIFLRDRTGKLTEFTIASARSMKSGYIVELEELSSLTDAERYRDADILVRKNALPRKEEDEYFWYELLGLDVFLESGEYLGPISDIIATGSNDIYVIKRGKSELLIPGTHEIIKNIDLERGKMMIHPIDGLLDLHEI
ncbi:MAG: 16S rRNA processing protein RimM [Deltaproteobacteria bacterium]|nr:16S rRNA processing protein RimM [Deltaproteobacteria bacterium]